MWMSVTTLSALKHATSEKGKANYAKSMLSPEIVHYNTLQTNKLESKTPKGVA